MFEVIWQPTALSGLAEIWTNSEDRQLISDATNRIDELLRESPTDAGESRANADRVVFALPLGVVFSVNESNRVVLVLRVIDMRGGKSDKTR